MRHCYVLRVFTSGDEGGNALGVVPDVTGLDTAAMQAIAADLGFSETAFLEWGSSGPPHVRIFTPASELPFAGHPLVGAAWVLGGLGPGTADRMTCGVGEITFRVVADRATVEVPGGQPVRPAPEAGEIAAAAGLGAPIGSWWVDMPIPYLVVEVSDAAAVAAAAPDIGALLEGPSGRATYLFARQGDAVTARFFAPGLGVPEDPATGSAAVALAAVLRAAGRSDGSLRVTQGAEIGSPSVIEVRWTGAGATLAGSVRRDEVRWLEA